MSHCYPIVSFYYQQAIEITHFARYNDSALSQIEPFFIIQKSEHLPDKIFLEQSHHFFKHEADEYIVKKRKELGPVVNNLILEITRLFDELLIKFSEEHNKF